MNEHSLYTHLGIFPHVVSGLARYHAMVMGSTGLDGVYRLVPACGAMGPQDMHTSPRNGRIANCGRCRRIMKARWRHKLIGN